MAHHGIKNKEKWISLEEVKKSVSLLDIDLTERECLCGKHYR
jgi:hypothetical protein